MTYKVAIIEYNYHPEVLRNTLEILSDSPLDISVYTTRSIWCKVNLNESSISALKKLVIAENINSLFEKLKMDVFKINKYNLTLFDTVDSNYRKLSKLNIQSPKAIRIHNSYTFLSPKKKYILPNSLFQAWKDLSHFIRLEVISNYSKSRKDFLKTIDYYIFPDTSFMEYAMKSYQIPYSKSVSLPFSYSKFTISKKKINHKEMKVCIIGKIDKRYRDYSQIEELASFLNGMISENSSYTSVNFIFLGNYSSTSYGREFKKNITRLNLLNVNFTFFNEYIKQDVFDDNIFKCHYIFAPLKINTRFKIFREIYGSTKISGAINDAIRFGKPIILPSNYQIPQKLNGICLKFSTNEHLRQIFIDIINGNQSYPDTCIFTKHYNRLNIQRQYITFLENIKTN